MNMLSINTQLLEGWSLPIMVLDTKLRFIFANDAYLQAVHRTYEDIEGAYIFDVFPDTAERIEPVLSKFQATVNGAVTQLEAQPFQLEVEDGSTKERIWQATQDPLRDAKGTIIGLIQRCQDITHQHQLEQRNEAIGHELSHRIKNSMAVINAVARITARNASNVSEFVKGFTARIDAMSRTNDLLLGNDWTGLDIRAIFKSELDPFEADGHAVYTLNGPNVRLTIDASKTLSMICHELATNALKYGCLKKSGGTLHVHWTRVDDRLIIKWQEHCVHNITASEEVGFGTRLFDMIPHVTVVRDFTPTGLHLTITMDGEMLFA
ncbi:MAG: sensor histidine kinase [Litorimonas sp.]